MKLINSSPRLLNQREIVINLICTTREFDTKANILGGFVATRDGTRVNGSGVIREAERGLRGIVHGLNGDIGKRREIQTSCMCSLSLGALITDI